MSAATFQNFDCSSVVVSSLRSAAVIKMLVMGFLLRLLTATIAAFMTQPCMRRSDDCPRLRLTECPKPHRGLQSLKTNPRQDAELKDVRLWTARRERT